MHACLQAFMKQGLQMQMLLGAYNGNQHAGSRQHNMQVCGKHQTWALAKSNADVISKGIAGSFLPAKSQMACTESCPCSVP